MNHASVFGRNLPRAALFVAAVCCLAFVLGFWVSGDAYAQEPDVSAAGRSVSSNVSGVVSFSSATESIVGTKTMDFGATVPIQQAVKVKGGDDGAFFRLRMTVSLTGTVPIYVSIAGVSSSTSAVMSGTLVMTTSQYSVASDSTTSKTVTGNVPINGSKKVTVSGSTPLDVFIYALYQSIAGTAKIELVDVIGSANLVSTGYMPIVARSNIYYYDDFSSDNGWWAIADDDDCEAYVEDGYLKVKIYEEYYDCYIATPDGVYLREGNFSVKASRRNSNLNAYALVFNASSDLEDERWLFQLLPFGGYECDDDDTDDDEGCTWLSWVNDPNDEADEWITITDDANLDSSDWNTLSVKRESDNVRAYINGVSQFNEEDESDLDDEGLFDLKVSSQDDTTVIVWFDDFTLTYLDN